MNGDNFLLKKLTGIGFIPPPPKWQLFITKYQSVFWVGSILLIIILSTINIYGLSEIGLTCIGYLAFIVFSRVFREILERNIKGTHFTTQFVINFIGLIAIVFGLSLFRYARGAIWLLLIFPNWGIARSEKKIPFGSYVAYLISIAGIGEQTYLLSPDNTSLMISTLIIKILWLSIILLIIYTYIDLIHRIEESKRQQRKIEDDYSKRIFNVLEIGEWGKVILSEIIKLTHADYATFQVCNYHSGYLAMICAIEADISLDSCSSIKPDPTWERLKFSNYDNKGITTYAARNNKTIAILNVLKKNIFGIEYVELFPNVITEIATPIRNHIYDNVGGIINIEYKATNKFRPNSELSLRTQKKTMEEFGHHLGLSFSYVLLANLRNAIREIGVELDSAESEKEVTFKVIERLYNYYECPVGLWLSEEPYYERKKIKLEMSRGLPIKYVNENASLRITSSKLGQYYGIDYPFQVEGLSIQNVDNWFLLVDKIDPTPKGILVIPLKGYDEEPIGIVMMFTYEIHRLHKHELDLLQDLGSQIGLAISRFRNTYELKKQMLNYTATAAAHDIGSSITNIRSLIDDLFLIMEDTLKTNNIHEGNEIKETILSELDYLGDIRDLVNIKLIEEGKIVQREYKVNDLINQAVTHLTNKNELIKNQVIIKEVPRDVELVYCNKPIVVGTIKNILRNAAEASRDVINRKIEVEVMPDNNSQFENVLIKNYGPKIDPEIRKKIFEPGVSTKGGQGVGLGVYRELVRKIGGTLTLELSNDTATIFKLKIKRIANESENTLTSGRY